MLARVAVLAVLLTVIPTQLCAAVTATPTATPDNDAYLDTPAEDTPAPPEPKKAAPAKWTLDPSDTRRSPSQWAGLDVAYRGCGTKRQSPIDIREVRESPRLPALDWTRAAVASAGRTSKVELVNGGNGVMDVSPYASDTSFLVGNKEYEIMGVRFHSPSEHSIRGTHFPLEAQVEARGEANDRLFVSVFFVEGEDNAALGAFWKRFPPDADSEVVKGKAFSVRDILPKGQQYYQYKGTDTRPPCEAAKWILLKDPVQVGEDQIEDFRLRSPVPTRRPIQAFDERDVRISDVTPWMPDGRSDGDLTVKTK